MDNKPIIVKNSGYVELKRIVDERDGVLSIMEGQHDVPFDIKRVYYINNLENLQSVRGKHAHKELKQVIFCINGSFVLTLDDGEKKQDIHMWRDNVGVILGKELWHTMHSFLSGCVLLVVASDFYKEEDYIRDYEEFLNYVGSTK
ncbi:MAG: WxcM-like domain-containing protein [Lentisphaerae bacterium]|nr:WxcM-like domain-containing protein [Lentisphaerota bacterium]MCP4100703.1 WxcM-like domain-containing protein [Lentisphaerota bacterium]